jgi:thioredoxin 1
LTPRLDAAIAATEGKVNLALVDIDNLSDLALDYDVQAVPTVLAVKDGKVVDKFIGLIDEDKLGAFVNKLM